MSSIFSLELARRLQEEENRMAREEQQLRQQQQHRQQQHHQQQQMPHMQHQQPANQPLPRQHQQPQLHADGRNVRFILKRFNVNYDAITSCGVMQLKPLVIKQFTFCPLISATFPSLFCLLQFSCKCQKYVIDVIFCFPIVIFFTHDQRE